MGDVTRDAQQFCPAAKVDRVETTGLESRAQLRREFGEEIVVAADVAHGANDLGGWAARAGSAVLIPGRYRGRMSVRHRRVMQVAAGGAVTWRSDDVSTEEPLEIRVGDVSLSVTMRTPGDDFDLVAGFLITEGIVRDAGEIASMRMCPDAAAATGELNIVEVLLTATAAAREVTPRAFYMTSSCGMCGKASIDAVRTTSAYDVASDPLRVCPHCCSASLQCSGPRSGSSHAPAASTLRHCSTATARCAACARMSAATTPSTR